MIRGLTLEVIRGLVSASKAETMAQALHSGATAHTA